ncbi:MAG: outer membrane protein assembly factor BamD [Deltaproteobacteria bacterium]|nr:outer membrane protein assembly factor BamD [Deltaproteobacteria bacterium]
MFLLTLSTSCGKSMPSIGGGDPTKEFGECMKLSEKGKFEDTVQCLEMFKARYPQTKLGQEAELRIGDAYFAKKEYLLAAEAYLAYLRLHPRSRKADYAHFRIGEAYFRESPKAIDRDQEYLESAIDHLAIVIRRYPNSPYAGLAKTAWQKARKRVARRTFYIGRFYYRTGEYKSCIPRFLEVASRYPDSGLADKSLFKALEAALELKKIEKAKEAYGMLLSDYPDSKYTKSAEKKLLRRIKN